MIITNLGNGMYAGAAKSYGDIAVVGTLSEVITKIINVVTFNK